MYVTKLEKATALRQQIEVEVLRRLQELVEKELIDSMRAQSIAKYVLDIVPEDAGVDDLFSAVKKLGTDCSELAPVVATITRRYQEKAEELAQNRMHQLIAAGKFDDVMKLAQHAMTTGSREL